MTDNDNLREELRILVANLLPIANVFWEHKDTPSHLPPWNLAAALKKDATKYVSMRFVNDMDGHSLNDIAKDYEIHLGPKLNE